jgi:HEAT repeat protein
MPQAPPRVFISYSHDSREHQDRVLELADRLRAEGIDASIDQYEQAPPEGWPAWCEAEIDKADFVLVVCTATYHERMRREQPSGTGQGVLWEARLIKQELYDRNSASKKFIPVLFEDGRSEDIPRAIKGASFFWIETADGYEALYRLVTDQPAVRKPVLQPIRPMPERRRRSAATVEGQSSLQQEPGEASPTATDPPPPGEAEAIAEPGNAAAGTMESDIRVFLSKDPVAGNTVITKLAAHGPEILDLLLERTDSSRQVTIRLRKLCGLLGAPAVRHLVNAIRDGSWNAKSRAAPCFVALRGEREAASGLYDLLNVRDFDVQRLAIEAYGYLGHEDAQWNIERLAKYDDLGRDGIVVNRYSFGKLYTYVVEALTRFFAKSGDGTTIKHLTEFSLFSVEQTENWFYVDMSIARGLRDSSPAAADGLISEWLRHQEQHLRINALEGLASLRLGRTIPAIISVLSDKAESDEIRQKAGIALGAIGSAAAAQSLADILAGNPQGPGIDWAFSTLYAQPIEWPDCSRQIASTLSSYGGEVRQQMLLSLGWRGDVSFRAAIEKDLPAHDHFLRGTSALALAHLLGPGALDALNDCADEAANEWERVFMLAAQIHAGRAGCGDALHAALQHFELLESLRPVWRREILSAMALADGNTRRAELWAEVAGEHLDRLLVQINHLRAARGTGKH